MKIKKKIWTVLLTILFLGAAAEVLARGVQNVRNTPHNLSSSHSAGMGAWYNATNEDEICIFCHTPHGGDLRGQLWNRDMDALHAKSYTHYTSHTLSAAVGESTRAVSSESLLCLSCHDGSIAVGQILNFSNRTGSSPNNDNVYLVSMFGNPGPKIGDSRSPGGGVHGVTNDLSDDHPISFSYLDVLAEYAGSPRAGHLKTIEAAELNGVRFFGNDKRLECSSCHDPHVDYGDVYFSPYWNNPDYTRYRPFLIRDNVGSGLCLSCHSK